MSAGQPKEDGLGLFPQNVPLDEEDGGFLSRHRRGRVAKEERPPRLRPWWMRRQFRREKVTPAARIRAAYGSQEVTVKVASFGGDAGSVRRQIRYITREGELELERANGEVIRGDLAELDAIVEEWREGFHHRRGKARNTIHMVLSCPKGVDREAAHMASLSFAAETFGENWDYVAVRHEDTDYPHTHVIAQTRGIDGKRFVLEPEDFQALRERFAEACRDEGLPLNATPRAARGVMARGEPIGVRKLRAAGLTPDRAGRPAASADAAREAAAQVGLIAAEAAENRRLAAQLDRLDEPGARSAAMALRSHSERMERTAAMVETDGKAAPVEAGPEAAEAAPSPEALREAVRASEAARGETAPNKQTSGQKQAREEKPQAAAAEAEERKRVQAEAKAFRVTAQQFEDRGGTEDLVTATAIRAFAERLDPSDATQAQEKAALRAEAQAREASIRRAQAEIYERLAMRWESQTGSVEAAQMVRDHARKANPAAMAEAQAARQTLNAEAEKQARALALEADGSRVLARRLEERDGEAGAKAAKALRGYADSLSPELPGDASKAQAQQAVQAAAYRGLADQIDKSKELDSSGVAKRLREEAAQAFPAAKDAEGPKKAEAVSKKAEAAMKDTPAASLAEQEADRIEKGLRDHYDKEAAARDKRAAVRASAAQQAPQDPRRAEMQRMAEEARKRLEGKAAEQEQKQEAPPPTRDHQEGHGKPAKSDPAPAQDPRRAEMERMAEQARNQQAKREAERAGRGGRDRDRDR